MYMQHSAQNGSGQREDRVPLDALIDVRIESRTGELRAARAHGSETRAIVHGDDDEQCVSADGLNVSIGGIAMRAPIAPPLGALLACSFDCPPTGERVSAQGRVVWSEQDGDDKGTFGLRFVELDTKSATALRRYLRPFAAQETQAQRLRTATLVIDGMPASVEAELKLADDSRVVLEQQLSFLQLGRGVDVTVPGRGRGKERGRIASVELRHSQIGVPTLVFGVLLDEAPERAVEPVAASVAPLFTSSVSLEPTEPVTFERPSEVPGTIQHEPERLSSVPSAIADTNLGATADAGRASVAPTVAEKDRALSRLSLPPDVTEQARVALPPGGLPKGVASGSPPSARTAQGEPASTRTPEGVLRTRRNVGEHSLEPLDETRAYADAEDADDELAAVASTSFSYARSGFTSTRKFGSQSALGESSAQSPMQTQLGYAELVTPSRALLAARAEALDGASPAAANVSGDMDAHAHSTLETLTTLGAWGAPRRKSAPPQGRVARSLRHDDEYDDAAHDEPHDTDSFEDLDDHDERGEHDDHHLNGAGDERDDAGDAPVELSPHARTDGRANEPPDALTLQVRNLPAHLRSLFRVPVARFHSLRQRFEPQLREQAEFLDLPEARSRLLMHIARVRGVMLRGWYSLRKSTAQVRSRKSRPLRMQRSTLLGIGPAEGEAPRPPQQKARMAALALAVLGIGLGVYALAPRGGADRIRIPERVETEQVAEPTLEIENQGDSFDEPVAPSEPKPQSAAKRDKRTVIDPALVDEPALEAAPSVVSAPFGEAEVPNGRVFTLRMNGPVPVVEGEARDGGFTVRIPGRLALDRASPIATSHRAVARAMILNRGGYAELTIDFQPGLSPRYQVRGKDDTLEVTLERL
jgi:hypothetical protein